MLAIGRNCGQRKERSYFAEIQIQDELRLAAVFAHRPRSPSAKPGANRMTPLQVPGAAARHGFRAADDGRRATDRSGLSSTTELAKNAMKLLSGDQNGANPPRSGNHVGDAARVERAQPEHALAFGPIAKK